MAVQRFETMLLLKTDLFLAHNFLFLVFLAFFMSYTCVLHRYLNTAATYIQVIISMYMFRFRN